MRESPSPLAPPRSIAAATPGEPSAALVTPVTRTPRAASRSTSVRVLVSTASRSISRRGALIECSRRATPSAPGRHRGPCRPAGRGAGSGDRSRATPSSSSIWSIAISISASSAMPSWLTVMPMTLVSAKASMSLTSLATVGTATIGKSPRTRRLGACWTITPAGWLPRRMCADVMYAGWLSAPWPSTTMTSGSSPSKAATTCASTSPEQNCGTRASSATPYLPPWMIVVWPVPTMTALTPRSLSARTRRVAVVRLPTAPSVPSTAIRGQVTSKMRPEKSLRSFFSLGRRTSVMVTPASRPAATNSASSLRNSCRPLMTCMPRAMPSSSTTRWAADSSPSAGASPQIR